MTMQGSYPSPNNTAKARNFINECSSKGIPIRVILTIDTHSAVGSGYLVVDPPRDEKLAIALSLRMVSCNQFNIFIIILFYSLYNKLIQTIAS